jgi:nitroreductase
MVTYQEYLELVQNRRSMRAFTEEDITDEQIKKIITAASYAPSGMNYQPWEFIVVRDKEVINKLIHISFEDFKMPESADRKMPKQMNVAKNPQALIVVVGDRRKNINLPGQPYDFKDDKLEVKQSAGLLSIESLYNTSMANAFLQMITAATTLGLGAQYVTLLTSVVKEQEARTLLNIPDYMDIFDAAAIGHPGYVPRKKYVKPVENAIHYDAYDKSKSMTDKEIVERAKTHEDYKYID